MFSISGPIAAIWLTTIDFQMTVALEKGISSAVEENAKLRLQLKRQNEFGQGGDDAEKAKTD